MRNRKVREDIIAWLLERPTLWLELPSTPDKCTRRHHTALDTLAQEAIAAGLYPQHSHPVKEIMRAVLKQVRYTRQRYISR